MGSACARVLAPAVDTLLLADVQHDALQATAEAIAPGTPAAVYTEAGDLADPASIDKLAARAAELGALHALVHTAGLSPSMAGWRDILRVDLVAPARLLDALLPLDRKR